LLELVSLGLALWLEPQISPLDFVIGQTAPWMVFSTETDAIAQTTLQQYLKLLSDKGLTASEQGVWLQAGTHLLASNAGTVPVPAASLTKVATSLAAVQTWGINHQFETVVSTTGWVQNGELQGDLLIQSDDPVFGWRTAIALGNALNQKGITRIKGDLLLAGNLAMADESEPTRAGELLKAAWDAKNRSDETEYHDRRLPPNTPRPQLTIAGTVRLNKIAAPKQMVLVRQQSLPLVKILKRMNVYSSNPIAESLAMSLGGAANIIQKVAQVTGVPSAEILLKNGSGLGVENRLSPRAVCAMFTALQRVLHPVNLTLADLFPIAGTDEGTLEDRKIPTAAVVKTGTLKEVSALAGALPTRDRGVVWFTIINRGTDLDDLRLQQERLLQQWAQQWGLPETVPIALVPATAKFPSPQL
jgi:D-alanyl-D-alanine carboxypeptidase/D-alanyl-D-alanine-endopeptidase (penicillin-binding protein 4)